MKTPAMNRVRLSRSALSRHYDAFLRSLRSHRPETKGTYARSLREFLRWHERESTFQFRVEDVRRYRAYLTGRKKLAPVSVSTYLTSLRRFCAYLVGAGVLRENPATFVQGNERPREHTREYLTPADVEAALASVPTHDLRGLRDYAIMKLMIGCALSEIEIIRADIADLQTANNDVVLKVQGKGHTAKDEQVVLPPDVHAALLQYLAARGPAQQRAPMFASAGNRTRGRRMTTRGIRDRVNLYLERAGIRQGKLHKVTPYSLRHTAALLMAQQGMSADDIRKHMRLGSNATARLYLTRATETPSAKQQPKD